MILNVNDNSRQQHAPQGPGAVTPDTTGTKRTTGTSVLGKLARWTLVPVAGGVWLLVLLGTHFSMLAVALGLLLGIAVLSRA